MTTDLFATYVDTRGRILDLIATSDAAALTTQVPSCPDWNAMQLFTHCVSLPAAIAAGELPQGDLDAWIDSIIVARSGRTIDELTAEWSAADDTIASMVNGGGAVLLNDLVVHEHDLRAALGRPDHSTLDGELMVPRALESCVPELERRGLGAIEVRDAATSWRSHDAPVGWVLEVTPWEAVRALYSRRTVDELRAASSGEGVDAYIALLDDHLPLPTVSLGER